jgi:cytidylate kinase
VSQKQITKPSETPVLLEQKEDKSKPPANQASSQAKDPHRERLVAFYEKHEPSKLKDVEKLLKKFKGREDEMFQRIADKYKIDAKQTSVGLPQVATSTPPSQVAAAKAGSKDVQLLEAVNKSPDTTKHTGSKADAKDASAMSGTANMTLDQKDTVPSQTASATDAGQVVHRDRLIKFYTDRAPEKLKDVDKLLKKFKGREEAMYKRIAEVYKVKVEDFLVSGSTVESTESLVSTKAKEESPSATPVLPAVDATTVSDDANASQGDFRSRVCCIFFF